MAPATPIVFAAGSPADASFTEGVGGQLAFALSAGSHPMTYQWRKNGAPIPGAVGDTLPLGSITPADAGRYSVTVTNAAGSVTSREATVTVVRATPIEISVHPTPLTVFEGQEARFTVDFRAGTQPIRYQWLKNGVAIQGATSIVFAIAQAALADAADYSVVLTNPAGSVTSDSARLTVQPATTPTILRQPVGVTVPFFGSFSLSAQVVGTPPLTYRWTRDGQPISSGGPSLGFPEATPENHSGTYVLEVRNASGTVSTTPVSVTVLPPVPPVFLRQPASLTALIGTDVSFTVEYSTAGAGTVTVQWLKNGQPVGAPGNNVARFPTFFLTAVQPSDAGDYTAQLTSRAGIVTSSVARLTVTTGPAGPDYSGIYFGTRRGPSSIADVAMYIRPDRTGVFLLQDTNLPAAVATDFALNSAGEFRFEASSTRLTAFGKFTVSGSVSRDGTVTGSVAGTAFDAAKVTGDSPLAGYYYATATGFGTGETLAIVGANGRIVALAYTGELSVAAAGTLDANGRLSATNPNDQTISLSLDPVVGELATTASGPRASRTTFLGVREGMVRSARLANISTRGRAGAGDDAMIAGFVVSGPGTRSVLVRAIGPALASFGVNGALADAKLTLFRGSTALMESDDWGTEVNASGIAAAAARVGAFALAPAGRDAVLLATLEAGNYTAQVTAKNGVPGVALVEVYDAGDATEAAAPRLVNIATRGWVGTGDEALIAGIVVTGNAPKTVLIRAIGPGLARLGVAGTLADPTLTVQQGNATVATNDDWSRLDGSNSIIAVLSATEKVGAFSLGNSSLDAALIVRLNPGNYTASVNGKGSAGVALIEVYEVEP